MPLSRVDINKNIQLYTFSIYYSRFAAKSLMTFFIFQHSEVLR